MKNNLKLTQNYLKSLTILGACTQAGIMIYLIICLHTCIYSRYTVVPSLTTNQKTLLYLPSSNYFGDIRVKYMYQIAMRKL